MSGRQGKNSTVRQKVRSIFKASPDVILIVDRKRRIRFMSRAMKGPRPKKMIGRDATRLLPKRARPWFRRAIRTAFASGEGSRFQYPTAESVWWEIRLIPRPGEALIIATEVTEARIHQSQAIRHARLATIGVLATSIAHEINNPNNAILFNAALLARVWDEAAPILEEYHQDNGEFSLGGLPFDEARTVLPGLIREISHNTMRVKGIVENLKHLARREPESLNELVDIHEPLQAALMILNHKIRRHTDHCALLSAREALTVRGNSRQLEQVFINVILNALQSLPDRNRHVWIRVAAEGAQERKQVLVTVEDEGVGIAPEHLAHVTEPFFTTRSANGGTGLGLSISALILRNHGAALHFAPRVGRGTTVTIRFPGESLSGVVP
ncbi:MAG: PAS domain-containing protein [Magnetococcales bacterium]|nr:PAS domain-containing protein [Magnetococcales bacterium]